MPFSLSKASLPVFEIVLDALSGLLDKADAFAAAKKFDPAVLLAWRISPDMFPFVRQVQIVTDQAKNGSARLAGVEPPRFEDNETSIEQLRVRLARTIDYLRSIPAAALEGAETRTIQVKAGEHTLEFKGGAQFLERWAIPNVYFHVTTAYAILRHYGVELVKRDFLAGEGEL